MTDSAASLVQITYFSGAIQRYLACYFEGIIRAWVAGDGRTVTRDLQSRHPEDPEILDRLYAAARKSYGVEATESFNSLIPEFADLALRLAALLASSGPISVRDEATGECLTLPPTTTAKAIGEVVKRAAREIFKSKHPPRRAKPPTRKKRPLKHIEIEALLARNERRRSSKRLSKSQAARDLYESGKFDALFGSGLYPEKKMRDIENRAAGASDDELKKRLSENPLRALDGDDAAVLIFYENCLALNKISKADAAVVVAEKFKQYFGSPKSAGRKLRDLARRSRSNRYTRSDLIRLASEK